MRTWKIKQKGLIVENYNHILKSNGYTITSKDLGESKYTSSFQRRHNGRLRSIIYYKNVWKQRVEGLLAWVVVSGKKTRNTSIPSSLLLEEKMFLHFLMKRE